MRQTFCWRTVDETTDEQRASHKLRFAPFCAQCLSKMTKLGIDMDDVNIVFAERGARRHGSAKT